MEQQKHTATTIMAVLAITSFFFIVATAQSSLSSTCTNVLISLSPCLNYISGNSSSPSSGCCKQLATVVQSQPQCLCEVLNGGGSSLGISINQTQALALPTACNVQTPSISKCTTAASPSGSTKSPTTGSSSGSSSRSVPTTSKDSSDGNATKLSLSVILPLLFVASYVSAFGSI